MGSRYREPSGHEDVVLVCVDLLNLVSTTWTPLSSNGRSSNARLSIPSGGVTTFGPLIVKSFGFSDFNTILLNIPFGAVQIVATMGGAAFATWTKRKGPALALLCIPSIIGCVMLLTISHSTSHRGPLLVGYYLVRFPHPQTK